MEKQHKPKNPTGNKRHRKNLPTAASVPKNMKLVISDTDTNSKPLDADRTHSAKSKLSPVESVTLNSNLETQISIKKKSKKAKHAAKVANNLAMTSLIEPKKQRKRQASLTLSDSSKIAAPSKKPKKHKELVAEFNTLREEVLGPTKVELTPEKSPEKLEKLQKPALSKVVYLNANVKEEKFPILKDEELINKFLKVPLNNNQKGRIRQAIKLSLQGSSATMFPDIINGKIQAILNSSVDLTDSELRRVRILYNMLKTAIEKPEELEEGIKSPKKKDKKKKEVKEGGEDKEKNPAKKVKGPKRYVVFLGNLPLDINKDKIMEHFRELNEHIVDIRLPKLAPGTKSAIAYVELSNEPSYELALSKHHSMLGNRRIKVLYTTQKNGKITKGEAKGKSAKLIALQKAGKLVGSVPTTKKRSHRRNIMKKAKANEAEAAEL